MAQNHKIITISGLTIDLSRIKAIKINTNSTLGPTNVLTVDLNSKYEYIFNPNKDKFKKQIIKDQVEIEYVDFNTAKESSEELIEEWQQYLSSLTVQN